MPDRKPYSVITNFGCHWKCPYCIVRNTGILVPETDFALTERTVMDLADGGGMGFLSFSGGGDPLWMLDARRAEWYSTLTRRLHALGIETEMHTSMSPMTERLYRLASETEFTRIVYHLRNVNMIRRLSKRRNELVRVVFVVTPDFTEDLIDRIVEEMKANPQVDELSFRQMVKPDYTIDHTCETYLRAGHRKDWWYIEQGDYNQYIVNDRISGRYEDFTKGHGLGR
jgi:pyruvate-formate lyase-activating enzyme